MASNLIGRLRVPLQTEGDRQFYTRVLLAQLGELAVGELAPVDEIAERTVGELNPIRTAGKPRRSGVLGNPEIGDAIRAGKEITGIALVFEAAATASGWRAGLRRWNRGSRDPWLECRGIAGAPPGENRPARHRVAEPRGVINRGKTPVLT